MKDLAEQPSKYIPEVGGIRVPRSDKTAIWVLHNNGYRVLEVEETEFVFYRKILPNDLTAQESRQITDAGNLGDYVED